MLFSSDLLCKGREITRFLHSLMIDLEWVNRNLRQDCSPSLPNNDYLCFGSVAKGVPEPLIHCCRWLLSSRCCDATCGIPLPGSGRNSLTNSTISSWSYPSSTNCVRLLVSQALVLYDSYSIWQYLSAVSHQNWLDYRGDGEATQDNCHSNSAAELYIYVAILSEHEKSCKTTIYGYRSTAMNMKWSQGHG